MAMDWAAHDHRPGPPAPARAPAPLTVCWRVIGVSSTSKPVTCAIYEAPAGRFEVRAGFAYEDPLRTQVARTRRAAEDIAAIWKMAAIEKGFTELPRHAQ